mmetsp:Transcript_65808/g.183319  ORF Transcript_65808/g.183319 Transcript_65808/m.183319 type:complete len:716 (+) Transcript_65808:54-2201(+)
MLHCLTSRPPNAFRSPPAMDMQHLQRLGIPLCGFLGAVNRRRAAVPSGPVMAGTAGARSAEARRKAGLSGVAVGKARRAPAAAAASLTQSGSAAAPGPALSSVPSSGPDIVAHTEPLPDKYASMIPASDERILRFFLRFLESEGLTHVSVFINGGYVRDLLLGRTPDDLDLSFCLCDCPEDVTVGALLDRVLPFAASHPDLGIADVKIATILSDETKNKMLDTCKAYFVDGEGQKVEVDIMPTIGEEVYEEGSRIPVRDQRGTPKQDALRRDLTIGAMLLQVEFSEASPCGRLRYRLLDFYGGAEDLSKGVLRGPCPDDKSLEDILASVLQAPEDEELATQLGLRELPENEAVQVLWWARILMEDPVRICRALRFAAKLKGFNLHTSFWQAVPFALQALRCKVAGSRKNTEYQKIAGYGLKASLGFLDLAFNRTFRGLNGDLRLAAFLFGGADGKGRPHSLSQVLSFDTRANASFRALASTLEGADLEASELFGTLLASAIYVADLEGHGAPSDEFARACDGMCVSNAVRDAGALPLQAAMRLAQEPPQPNSLDRAFAAVCRGMSSEELCFFEHCYDALKLAVAAPAKPETHGHRQKLALAMVRHTREDVATRVEVCHRVLARPRPPIKGSVLSIKGLLEVPPQLRGQVMKLFDIGLRVLEYDGPLENEAQLMQLFESHPGFRQAFSSSTWFEDNGRTLRPEFQPPKGGKKAAKV